MSSLISKHAEFSLTVSLTATFGCLLDVALWLSRLLLISFKLLKIDVLGNYCFVRLSNGIAFNVNDLPALLCPSSSHFTSQQVSETKVGSEVVPKRGLHRGRCREA